MRMRLVDKAHKFKPHADHKSALPVCKRSNDVAYIVVFAYRVLFVWATIVLGTGERLN